MDCVFCDIVRGRIPARVIYEDAYTLVFLDNAGDVDGHMLAISKRHVKSLLDCDGETLHHVMDTVKTISAHCVDHCGYEGVNLLHASGGRAGQSVSHFHIHMIPRKRGDGVEAWPKLPGSHSDPDHIHQALRVTQK